MPTDPIPAYPNRRFNVTAEDIRKSNWEIELSKAERRDCDHYYTVLFARAAELSKLSKECEAGVFDLLGTVAVLHPDYNKRQPYEWELNRPDGPRLAHGDLDELRDVLNETLDPEFRAKIADVLWEMGRGTRNLDLARTAIEAFLASADRLEEPDMWVPFVERLERALQLAGKVQRGKELHCGVLTVLEEKCAKHAPNVSAGLLCGRLMDLMLAHNHGDPVKYAAVSTQLAEANEGISEWLFAHKYWHRAVEWYRRAKDDRSAQEAALHAGETLVKRAESNLSSQKADAGFASYWIGVARQELERAGASTSRLTELHRRMLELQAKHMDTMRPLDLPEPLVQGVDEMVGEMQPQARSHVAGLDLSHALFRLAMGFPVTDVEALRKGVETNSKKFIWNSLVAQSVVSADGRVLANAPPLPATPGDEREAAFEKEMLSQAKQWHWWFRAVAMIGPARQQIEEDHRPSLFDLAFLVFGNPAVPPGRERLIARGLLAGFHEDWVTALHLLVPQMENALRFVLARHGIITSAIKADRTQPELSLDWLLTRDKSEELLGAGMRFDLRGLLTSKFGINLRNEIAHGLAEEGAFYTPFAEYVWWLALRWLFLPKLWQNAISGDEVDPSEVIG